MGEGLAAATEFDEVSARLQTVGQEHLLRFWDELNADERTSLLGQIGALDLALTDRLISKWIRGTPAPEAIERIEPVDVIPIPTAERPDAREAWDVGEKALRDGRVGIVLVAGGQGTRLGYDGPKGTFPIGPASGRTLFQYHADRILYAQERSGRTLPWYIMVGESNEDATRAYFEDNDLQGIRRD